MVASSYAPLRSGATVPALTTEPTAVGQWAMHFSVNASRVCGSVHFALKRLFSTEPNRLPAVEDPANAGVLRCGNQSLMKLGRSSGSPRLSAAFRQ